MNFAGPDTASLQATIERATASQYAAAVELLALSLPDGAREEQRQMLRQLVASVPSDGFDLLVAMRQERLVGAILGMLSSGRVAAVWPPQVVAGEQPSTATELHAALQDVLAARQVDLLQAALHPHDVTSANWLERHGYDHIADLLYLRVPVAPPTSMPPVPTELTFTAYRPRERRRLARIVEATYEATLDCPRFDGWRAVDDVLDGYEATGVFAPARWQYVQYRGEDVGCLLLTEHAGSGAWEILYMGLAVPYRRRGWGRVLVERALACASAARQEQLLVAVDRLNAPALSVYRGAGFVPWGRRKVLAQQLAEARTVGSPPDAPVTPSRLHPQSQPKVA